MADLVLGFLLLFAVPGYRMWKSLVRREPPTPPKMARYLSSIALAIVLDAILLLDWLRNGRSPGDLGLGALFSPSGLVGLGLAGALVVILGLAMQRAPKRKGVGATQAADMLPTTRNEFLVFLVFSMVAGFSWELLFRGYLLWLLRPRIGLALAVAAAAGAYGAAHGFKTPRLFAGSLLSALVFTLAYVASGSLWWLAILHSVLPLMAAMSLRAKGRTAKPVSILSGTGAPDAPATAVKG